ncbi:excinuclease ABC subunit UvrC [Thermoleophilia bacterium SCSIO 60948]|nr:excinuclease ABC subunit UvrC [Thermoleophilia bacterium SCSIO 60948]
MSEAPEIETLSPSEDVREQRRKLPDQPGVYLFRAADGEVIYVGKALSIRKRVGGHFSGKSTRGVEMTSQVRSIDFLVTETEAEALLAEQQFIKRHRPRFNIRLRDDKSYPYIAVSLDEDYPRVYFTRERHRSNRAYFGPFSNAKRVRETLELLGKLFQYRTCDGPEPGRRSGVPCLDYYIKRCGAPCVGYIDKEEYRRNIEAITRFLSGRYRDVVRDLEAKMSEAAAAEEYERASILRDRLAGVRSLMERRTVASDKLDIADVIAVAVEGEDANAQVFQVRDGILAERQSFYLHAGGERDEAEVTEEFLAQYYSAAPSVPKLIVLGPAMRERAELLTDALSRQRGAAVEVRVSERGDKRRLRELAARNAKLALAQDKLRSERRRSQRVDALSALAEALELPELPVRIEGFDISNLGGEHTVASMVVFEGGAPKKSDYRRFGIRGDVDPAGVPEAGAPDGNGGGPANGAGPGNGRGRHSAWEHGPDDFASMEEVIGRRVARMLSQADLSPHDKKRDESFASVPSLILIDGGKGQLSAAVRALEPLRRSELPGAADLAVIGLAKREEEVFVPGRSEPIEIPADSEASRLLQRVRDEAHRFALDFHRKRRDKSVTGSILDGMRGVGPARKRALLQHFGSPERMVAASREEFEAVPGIPGKLARDIHRQLHKAGR